jgi:hypothetical protein
MSIVVRTLPYLHIYAFMSNSSQVACNTFISCNITKQSPPPPLSGHHTLLVALQILEFAVKIAQIHSYLWSVFSDWIVYSNGSFLMSETCHANQPYCTAKMYPNSYQSSSYEPARYAPWKSPARVIDNHFRGGLL